MLARVLLTAETEKYFVGDERSEETVGKSGKAESFYADEVVEKGVRFDREFEQIRLIALGGSAGTAYGAV